MFDGTVFREQQDCRPQIGEKPEGSTKIDYPRYVWKPPFKRQQL